MKKVGRPMRQTPEAYEKDHKRYVEAKKKLLEKKKLSEKVVEEVEPEEVIEEVIEVKPEIKSVSKDIMKEPTLKGAMLASTGRQTEEIEIINQQPHNESVMNTTLDESFDHLKYTEPVKPSFTSRHKYKIGGVLGGLVIATGLGLVAGAISKVMHDKDKKEK